MISPFASGKMAPYMAGQQRDASPIPHAGIQVGEIVAWRLWRAEGYILKSLSAPVTWIPGKPMEGDPARRGPSGVYEGVYAVKSCEHPELFIYRQADPHFVLGQVKLWGEIVEHARGYRAQFASIVDVRTAGPAANLGLIHELYVAGVVPDELTPVCEMQDDRPVAIGVTSLRPHRRAGMVDSLRLPQMTAPSALTAAFEDVAVNLVVEHYTVERWRVRPIILLQPGQDLSALPHFLPIAPRPLE